MSRYTYNANNPLPPTFRTCPLCKTEFRHGDGLDALALLPDDDKNINKMLDDCRWSAVPISHLFVIYIRTSISHRTYIPLCPIHTFYIWNTQKCISVYNAISWTSTYKTRRIPKTAPYTRAFADNWWLSGGWQADCLECLFPLCSLEHYLKYRTLFSSA